MNTALRIVLALPGLLFLFAAARWLVDPSGAAAGLGMALLDGVGRSTQIGDMSAFFAVLGAFTLAGAVTRQRVWFHAPVALLSLTAAFRVLAWLLHDAALAADLITVEVVIATLLWVGSGYLCRDAN